MKVFKKLKIYFTTVKAAVNISRKEHMAVFKLKQIEDDKAFWAKQN